MGKFKSKFLIVVAIILLFTAISILFFPTISNFINQFNNQVQIKKYNNNIFTLSKTEKHKFWSEAQAYNDNLSETVNDAFTAYTYKNIKPDYKSVLNFNDGQICSVQIPKINVNLPVYHGVSEDALIKGAIHSANTSFPIGGKNTHSIISAHTAYPGKMFFDNLTDLKEGDIFFINVLDEKLVYKVCDISIVKPTDTSKLQIEYDKDLITLVTCYPYAVNTHRLLVTGERTNDDLINTDELKNGSNSNYIVKIIFLFVVISVVFLIIFIKFKKWKGLF